MARLLKPFRFVQNLPEWSTVSVRGGPAEKATELTLVPGTEADGWVGGVRVGEHVLPGSSAIRERSAEAPEVALEVLDKSGTILAVLTVSVFERAWLEEALSLCTGSTAELVRVAKETSDEEVGLALLVDYYKRVKHTKPASELQALLAKYTGRRGALWSALWKKFGSHPLASWEKFRDVRAQEAAETALDPTPEEMEAAQEELASACGAEFALRSVAETPDWPATGDRLDIEAGDSGRDEGLFMVSGAEVFENPPQWLTGATVTSGVKYALRGCKPGLPESLQGEDATILSFETDKGEWCVGLAAVDLIEARRLRAILTAAVDHSKSHCFWAVSSTSLLRSFSAIVDKPINGRLWRPKLPQTSPLPPHIFKERFKLALRLRRVLREAHDSRGKKILNAAEQDIFESGHHTLWTPPQALACYLHVMDALRDDRASDDEEVRGLMRTIGERVCGGAGWPLASLPEPRRAEAVASLKELGLEPPQSPQETKQSPTNLRAEGGEPPPVKKAKEGPAEDGSPEWAIAELRRTQSWDGELAFTRYERYRPSLSSHRDYETATRLLRVFAAGSGSCGSCGGIYVTFELAFEQRWTHAGGVSRRSGELRLMFASKDCLADDDEEEEEEKYEPDELEEHESIEVDLGSDDWVGELSHLKPEIVEGVEHLFHTLTHREGRSHHTRAEDDDDVYECSDDSD